MAAATKLWDSVFAIPVGQAQTVTTIVQGFRPVAGKRGASASNLRKTQLLQSWQGDTVSAMTDLVEMIVVSPAAPNA